MKAEKFLYFSGGTVFGALTLLLLQRSELFRSQETPSQFLRLHWHGGWGVDGDIWVYPDDTYRVRRYNSHSGAVETDRTGRHHGLFSELVATADARHAWQITTASLNDEVSTLTPKGHVHGVMDSNHAFLEFRLPDRTLVADFYASDSFAKFLPDAQQLKTFAMLEAAFYRINLIK